MRTGRLDAPNAISEVSFEQWLTSLGRAPQQGELDRVLFPLLASLQRLHAQGKYHCAISPETIRIRHDGSATLHDGGNAGSAARAAGYLAPEQVTSTEGDTGTWTDIYGLAGTLYRAVTGSAPPLAADRLRSDAYVSAEKAAKSFTREHFLKGIDAALTLGAADRPKTIALWREQLGKGLPDFAIASHSIQDTLAIDDALPRTPPANNLATARTGVWIAVVLILSAVGAGSAFIYWYDSFEKTLKEKRETQIQEREMTDHKFVLRIDTIDGYKEFLNKYPSTRHAVDIRKRIDQLKEARAREEDIDWKKANAQDSVEGYGKYLAKWPHGQFAAPAARRLEELETLQITDEKMWAVSLKENSESAYRAYLKAFPNGAHVRIAKDKIRIAETQREQADWNSATRANTRESYVGFVSAWPDGPFTSMARRKLEDLAMAEAIRQGKMSDDLAWAEAAKASTRGAIEAYLQQFPRGAHVEEARRRLSRDSCHRNTASRLRG